MATHEFYATDNHHNERQIRILSVGSLVSKPPTKEKRISLKVRMPLSGTVNMGAPEWIDEAFLYVCKHGSDKVTPDVEIKGYSIDLSAENLFGKDIKSPNCIMKGFEIAEFGNEENPDVSISFTIRLPFSGPRWNWLGQYVGEEVWAKFIPGESGTAFVEDEDGTLLDDGENDGEADLDPDDEHDGPKLVKASGPKELAAFHEGEVEKEEKRGPGRPKKSVVADAF
jgi:hypothetical protein